MKSNTGVALAVIFTGTVSFFIGVLFARVFPDGESKPLSDLMIAAIGAFAGTAAGAWIALSADRTRREQETEDRHVEAANSVIFSLSQIYSHAVEYNQRIVLPRVSDPYRWYLIPGFIMQPPAVEAFDAGQLAFLFEGPHKSIPSRIALDFVRFEAFVPVKGFLDTRLQLTNSIMPPTFPSPRSIPAGAERVT
jgi:hypothetical protein